MPSDQANTNDNPIKASGNAIDKPAATPAEKNQDGALRRMQDEALPKGPSITNTTTQPEAGTAKNDAVGNLPSLTIVDDSGHEKSQNTIDLSKSSSGPEVSRGIKTDLIDMTNAISEPPGGDSSKQISDPPTEVSRSPNFDSKKPTAAFLDQFEGNNIPLSSTTSVSHGLISLAAAQKSGFNTIGLNVGDGILSEKLNGVGDQIERGKLPLGKGDVLNVSLYTIENQPTFKAASDFLGFPVDGKNLKGEREHILQRMGEITKDPSRSNSDKDLAAAVLNTNQAIDRIQKNGVEVIHSAGNLGADHFDWEFMNAKTQLSSHKPSGAPDDFSASNSLTTNGDGVLPVRFNRELDILDPTSASHQVGTLEIGDTGVKFPEHGIGGVLSQNTAFNRENPERPKNNTVFSLTKETAEEFNSKPAERSLPGYQYAPTTKTVNMTSFVDFLPGSKANVPDTAAAPGEKSAIGYLSGTSISNIKYLRDNFERLKKEKTVP